MSAPRLLPLLVPALALLLVGCSDGPAAGPCTGPDPNVACGRDCDVRPCPAGLHCGGGNVCTADCDPATNAGCGPGAVCTPDGRCERPSVGDGATAGDAGDPFICADVRLETERVTPNVILVVDQSGSMDERFDGRDRWNALRDSLLDDEGLLRALQSEVRFGLALFSARDDAPPSMCPMVSTVDPALDNYDAIADVYAAADPIDETPTGDSLDVLIDRFTMTPDPSRDPYVFILATDGEPDRCEELNPQNGQEEAIAAVERAYGLGIRTFMLSVGEGVVSERHMQDVANAGVGVRDGEPDAPFWVAGDDEGLREALMEISSW